MSVADELQKLVALKDSGALTDAEFQQQKARLLMDGANSSAPGDKAPAKKGGSYFPVMGVALAVLLGVFFIVFALSG